MAWMFPAGSDFGLPARLFSQRIEPFQGLRRRPPVSRVRPIETGSRAAGVVFLGGTSGVATPVPEQRAASPALPHPGDAGSSKDGRHESAGGLAGGGGRRTRP